MVEILDEVILCQIGCFRRVRRYLRGKHPDRGVIVRGITGWETLEETTVVVATHTFLVINSELTEVENG